MSLAVAASLVGCEAATQPPYFRVVTLSGSPYERGYQHGALFHSEIRSLYTQMLTASILPFLNRERPDIASVLVEYEDPIYEDGQFSYQLMLQSALSMEGYIPGDLLEEIHGIADGAGLPYEEVLILNTFLDTMLALRSITFFIRGMESPYVVSVEVTGGLDRDGVDNDGDGEVDEEAEGSLDPYEPLPHAALVEVPVDATVRFLLVDQGGAGQVLGLDDGARPEGVDPETVRVQVDDEVIEAGDPRLQTRSVSGELGTMIEVTLDPDGDLPPAAVVSLLLQAGDLSLVTDPPPSHARFMRDERIVLTTEGYGATPAEVESRGARDGRTQPPSIAFAARGSATADGAVLLAHHYALLDANTSHKHTVLFVHDVDEGIPHVVLGWTGLAWGFSGMNAEGLAYGVNSSDTLDNGMVVDVLAHMGNLSAARLVGRGVPVGLLGRAILSGSTTVDEAVATLADSERTYGWSFLLADRASAILAVELDSDIMGEGDGGLYAYAPSDGSPAAALASVGPDDLRLACHYVANTEDMSLSFIRPQRYWSSFYFRSLRAHSILGEHIEGASGALDVASMIETMRDPDLVDPRDSMSAVVFEPETGRLHVAMGQVPATAGEFRPFDITELLEGFSP